MNEERKKLGAKAWRNFTCCQSKLTQSRLKRFTNQPCGSETKPKKLKKETGLRLFKTRETFSKLKKRPSHNSGYTPLLVIRSAETIQFGKILFRFDFFSKLPQRTCSRETLVVMLPPISDNQNKSKNGKKNITKG